MRASLFADATHGPVKRLAFLAVVACLCGLGFSAPPAEAGYVVTILEQGNNVVGTGSGSLDLTDLGLVSSGGSAFAAAVEADIELIQTGPTISGGEDAYAGYSGPSNFGGGGSLFYATSGSGDFVGIESPQAGTPLLVPEVYQSGAALSSTSTWDNSTLASLGLTPGTYVYSWGSGEHADSFTVQIGPAATATPEPASLTLVGLGVAGIAGYAWRRRR
jgi:hypothetical protein